MNSKARDLEE